MMILVLAAKVADKALLHSIMKPKLLERLLCFAIFNLKPRKLLCSCTLVQFHSETKMAC